MLPKVLLSITKVYYISKFANKNVKNFGVGVKKNKVPYFDTL